MNSKDALDKLKEIIGDANYSRVVQELAGCTVYFPSDTEWTDKSLRNIQLCEDFYSGQYEISDLAKKYNLSISRVYKIIQNKA